MTNETKEITEKCIVDANKVIGFMAENAGYNNLFTEEGNGFLKGLSFNKEFLEFIDIKSYNRLVDDMNSQREDFYKCKNALKREITQTSKLKKEADELNNDVDDLNDKVVYLERENENLTDIVIGLKKELRTKKGFFQSLFR